jgi:hypothetical protein
MHYQLRTHYGRRFTSSVKLFMLIAIVILGLYLAFSGAGDNDNNSYTGEVRVEQTASLTHATLDRDQLLFYSGIDGRRQR